MVGEVSLLHMIAIVVTAVVEVAEVDFLGALVTVVCILFINCIL